MAKYLLPSEKIPCHKINSVVCEWKCYGWDWFISRMQDALMSEDSKSEIHSVQGISRKY